MVCHFGQEHNRTPLRHPEVTDVIEGRKSIAEQKPEKVHLARKLARARLISAQLAVAGHTTASTGKPYAPMAIQLMLAR